MFLRRLLSHSSIDYTNKLTNEFYSLSRTKRRLKNSSKSSTKTAPQAAITFSSNRIRPLWSDAVKAQKEKTRKETANIVRRRCYRRPWNKTKMERRNRTRKKDERRNKGDARKDLRSSRYVRFFFILLAYFYFSTSRSSISRTFAPGTCYLSGVLGLPKDAYSQTY